MDYDYCPCCNLVSRERLFHCFECDDYACARCTALTSVAVCRHCVITKHLDVGQGPGVWKKGGVR